MIVQDQADRAFGWIICVQILEQPNELNAPVPLLDASDDVSIQEVQVRQNRPRPMPDILMIASEGGVRFRLPNSFTAESVASGNVR